jgi:O-acetyl-ADP-ribose deacetylase
LELCVENGLKTVAFPNISTGVYRFPKDLTAQTAIKTVLATLTQYPNAFEKVIFCALMPKITIYKKKIR